ncbi:hypothetical protein TIFTF001_035011 [Ficus carica]|uniref:Ubiquitin-like protease family profile domain-containing protein n=1 Tax=Ficus carica TaxID=3494 RepID=A0AA88E2G0_FICCA|nr:hypothetical protein TIFTF001_035011 [Ficus carica]
MHPIPVTIIKDIPKQGNGGDCGMFTIKFAECLIEERDVKYWIYSIGHNRYDHPVITVMTGTLVHGRGNNRCDRPVTTVMTVTLVHGIG